MSADPLSIAQIVFAALGDIAFACVLGALMFIVWLRREHAFATVSPARRGWRRAVRGGIGASVVLALCNFCSLWLQSAAMSGSPIVDAGASLWLVALHTHAGVGWSVGLAGGVLILLSMTTARPLTTSRLALALLGALIAASGKAAIGHAADAGAFSLAEIVQTVHLLATGAWGGVVIAGALFVLPALDTSIARAALIRIVWRMSHAAMVAVALVLATGAFNAWRGIGGSVSVLTMSTWGHALLAKLALIAAALAFGALNRWRALPRLQRTASTMDAHTVINVMRIEALAIVGVFVAASVLSHSVPGMAMAG
jgi:copper resistance protein D